MLFYFIPGFMLEDFSINNNMILNKKSQPGILETFG